MPGGGLMAHEALGGHTLARHVGKSEQFLPNRLAVEPYLDLASTFFDRQTAEDALSQLLADNDRDVQRWLRSGSYRFTLIQKALQPVGRAIMRDVADSMPAAGMKLVLRRSSSMPTGYRIHTAMVEL
ncbi:MAG: hypothetical protein JO144_16350 [Actinobacteria bacterium]|nr:hypothetical protein [Actinomycetota bacterium]